MFELIIIMFSGLSLFLIILIFLFIEREKKLEQRFLGIEDSLEKLKKELYPLGKDNSLYSIYKEIEKIEKIVLLIWDSLDENQQNEIKKLKSVTEKDKILLLYKKGYSIEKISNSLKVSTEEVKTILKFFFKT